MMCPKDCGCTGRGLSDKEREGGYRRDTDPIAEFIITMFILASGFCFMGALVYWFMH